MSKVTKGEGWELIPASDRPGGDSSAAEQARRSSAAPSGQSIRVREETRAQGKVVTVARGFRLTENDLKAVAKDLKAFCGAGGTVAGDAVEVQGRHSKKVAERLVSKGYQVG